MNACQDDQPYIYLVKASFGEYDSYTEIICGVFTDETIAQQHAASAKIRADEHKKWNFELVEKAKSLPPKIIHALTDYSFESLNYDAARLLVRPEPPYETGEDFEVLRVRLNTWVSEGAEPI